MFESNFPVDKRGAGYVPLWNSFKLIAADCSADESEICFTTQQLVLTGCRFWPTLNEKQLGL